MNQEMFSKMEDAWTKKHGFFRKFRIEKIHDFGVTLRYGKALLNAAERGEIEQDVPCEILGKLRFVTSQNFLVRNAVSNNKRYLLQEADTPETKFKGTITDIYYTSAELSEGNKFFKANAHLASSVALDIGDQAEIWLIFNSVDIHSIFAGDDLEGIARAEFICLD